MLYSIGLYELKSFLAVEIDDILMETQNMIYFEISLWEFDTLFEYIFQEVPKLKNLNINIIQIEYAISIDQTEHIIKNIIQEYWVTNTKVEVKFHNSPFLVDTSFEYILFIE